MHVTSCSSGGDGGCQHTQAAILDSALIGGSHIHSPHEDSLQLLL